MEYVWSGRWRIQSDTTLYPIRYVMEKLYDGTFSHHFFIGRPLVIWPQYARGTYAVCADWRSVCCGFHCRNDP